MLSATQGVTCLGGDSTDRSTRYMGQPQLSSGIECWQLLKGLPAWEEIPQIYRYMGQPQLSSGIECWLLLKGLPSGRRFHRSTRYMGQPQLSSGIECCQLLKGLPAWEEFPQIYLVLWAATTFFRYRMLAATQRVTCLGGDSTDLPGTWGSHNFLQV